MLTSSNIFHRTFHIRWKDSTGTGFTVDHGSKQYMVTARHVVDGIKSGDAIKLFHNNAWKDLGVAVVGVGEGKVDVAVLACPVQLSSSLPLVPSAASLSYGQPVQFLGYPFGWNSGGENLNRGIPLPFVKAGTVSALDFDGDVKRIFLDAHVNKGFSGGPVVFEPYAKPNAQLHVAGIVSGFPVSTNWKAWLSVVDRTGTPITDPQGNPLGYVQDNPGIVVAFNIKHAVDMIDDNPIGFQLHP